MMTDTIDTLSVDDLAADNRRLRRLLDQRDAPGELRHRLQSTLAMLRVIIRRSAETNRDIDAYAAHLEDRLDAIARAQSAADEHGAIELHDLLADELMHYGAKDGERVALDGPEVQFRPRAGQVLALAIHELAVNAIEHGVLGGPAGHISVSWRVDDETPVPTLALVWKEEGDADVVTPSHIGFGTEVLTATVAYELKAQATLAFDADGLRYTLRFPLTDRIGTASSPPGGASAPRIPDLAE